MTDNAHLDLDALADVLADDASTATDQHLAGCAECRDHLEELRLAQARVAGELAALPPVAIPDDLAARLQDAWRESDPATGSATVTTLPPAANPTALRWLPAAAAFVLLLGGVGYGVSRLGDDSGGTSAAGRSAAKDTGAAALNVTRNSTGTDYTDRASLAASVPALLTGSAQQQQDTTIAETAPTPGGASAQKGTAPLTMAVADPLARLRGNEGLAQCLLALLPPDDPSVLPLALDYASFRGAPAMVVVLPGGSPDKLDVFVVGPACSPANDSTLFYASVDRP